MSSIWEEVKSRKIFKAATIYAAIAWGIIQIADIMLPILGGADWIMSSMVLLAFSGFPLALIAGWMFDLRLERIQTLQKSSLKTESFENDLAKNQTSPDKTLSSELSTDIEKRSLMSRFIELSVISLFGLTAAYLYYNSANEQAKASNSEQKLVTSHFNDPVNTQKTIAVLPFANFSDSTKDEYFADGLSEELLNVLARNKKLRVAARTSSFQYKNTNINIHTIAQELGVQYILEGSVRRSGDLIRVTAQLINADKDAHIFSKSWDRNTTDIFQVQDEIAASVMGELEVSLLGKTGKYDVETGTQNITAFAEYSRGMAMLRNRTKADFDGAIYSFKDAITLDPEYADAMAMLAQAYLLQSSYGLREPLQAYHEAKPLIEKAIELNPQFGGVHAVKGLMHWQNAERTDSPEEELAVATTHLAKAIDINPSLAEAYMWYGSILQQQGHFEKGAELHKQAFEIDPQAAVVGFNRAQDLVKYGKYKQAMAVFNTVVRHNPNYPNAYSIAGDVSFEVGQLDQAYAMYKRLAELSNDKIQWLVNSTRIYLPLGEYELAQKNMRLLKQNAKDNYVDKFNGLQATVWLASGDEQAFFDWTQSFEEESQNWSQRIWRGYAWLKQEKWKFAVKDLEQALRLTRQSNKKRVDEHTIRIQLFLASAYQALGNQLQAEGHLLAVSEELSVLSKKGFATQVMSYQQAAWNALQGNNEQALTLLRKAVQEGFVDFWWVESDPAFQALKRDPMFNAIQDEFKIRSRLLQSSIESRYGKLAFNE